MEKIDRIVIAKEGDIIDGKVKIIIVTQNHGIDTYIPECFVSMINNLVEQNEKLIDENNQLKNQVSDEAKSIGRYRFNHLEYLSELNVRDKSIANLRSQNKELQIQLERADKENKVLIEELKTSKLKLEQIEGLYNELKRQYNTTYGTCSFQNDTPLRIEVTPGEFITTTGKRLYMHSEEQRKQLAHLQELYNEKREEVEVLSNKVTELKDVYLGAVTEKLIEATFKLKKEKDEKNTSKEELKRCQRKLHNLRKEVNRLYSEREKYEDYIHLAKTFQRVSEVFDFLGDSQDPDSRE